jgi:diaminopimelate decarboxylase
MKTLLAAACQRWALDSPDGPASDAFKALARQHGTPLYVYAGPLIDRQLAALRAELPVGLDLLYALKANPHPAVLARLAPQVDGCDVASAAEIAMARQAGVAGVALSFAGPGKTDAELAAAIACDALVVVESLGEAQRLAALAAGRCRPRVALRVNPPFGLAADARMGGGPRPFGVDSEQAPTVLAELGRLPLDFEGFHVYAGSRCLDALAIAEMQRATLQLACDLAPLAPGPVRRLNLGGGLGIPCFSGESPLALDTLGDALRALARDAARRLPEARLALELGRFLVAEAGLYLMRVVERKASRGRTFLIVDGGAHHHWHATGALEGRRHLHFPLAVLGGAGRPPERVTVCGPLCAPHDVWAEDVVLPTAAVGDLLLVFQSGAYGASASPQAFLGKPPVAEILTEWPVASAPGPLDPPPPEENDHA